jgi:molybdate transport system ATP-binding protein
VSADALQVRARLLRGTFELEIEVGFPVGVTALSGPSGAGKSTLLSIIAGLERAEGRISCGDELWLDGMRARPPHRRGVAYVPQSLALLPHLSVLDNVMFGVDRALPAADREGLALATLARMHVVQLAPHAPRTLSGGEAQRVALARAFAMRPKAVLLDEPLSALDRGLREELVAELAILARELAVPFVYVTHDRREAQHLAERAVWIERGKVVRAGALEHAWPVEPAFLARLREVPG